MTTSTNPDPQQQQQPPPGIQVICAGLGRTGTLSLSAALTRLGYQTYHYLDFAHHQAWADMVDGRKTRHDMIQLIAQDGYTATLENPTCDIYQDVLQQYPDAKVILTVRDSPRNFAQSWKVLFDTMVVTEQKFSWTFPSFWGYIPTFANLKKIRHFMGTTHLQLAPGELTHGWRAKDDDEAWLAEQYERHNQHIIDHVPKDQLLVFNVKQGWEPLCQFLGKDIPDEPFPNVQVNTTSSLMELRKTFELVVYAWIPTTLLLGAGAAFLLSSLRGAIGTFKLFASRS